MKPEVLIGVVDSGHAFSQQLRVEAGRRFWLYDDQLLCGDLEPDQLGHGSAVIEAIARRAPGAQVCVAQVFDRRGVTSAWQLGAAIGWLVSTGVRVINLSLGLRHDREMLRDACALAVEQGVLLCAASPAQGKGVYPADYPHVLRVTGDARCASDQWSWLDSAQADFAACVQGVQPGQSGASMGCAALSGHIASYLLEHSKASNDDIIQWLQTNAHYRGPERRLGA